MKPEILFKPQGEDRRIANLIQHLDIPEEQQRAARQVHDGSSHLTQAKLELWVEALDSGHSTYMGYTKQRIEVGGLFATQEAIDLMRKQWLFLANEILAYRSALAAQLGGHIE